MESNKENISETRYVPFEPRMQPSSPDSLNVKRTIVISFAFFSVLLAWSYFNFKIPLLLDNIIPDFPLEDILIGVIMALDNIIAVLFQPYFGDLSDRTMSKYGRRMPYIIIGTITAAVFFIIIPWVQVLAGLIIIILLFDFAMSIYRSPSIAILPDYTSEKVYAKASAIQQFIANIGGLIAFTIPMIVGALPLGSVELVNSLGFLIVGVLMIGLLLLQLLVIKETPTGNKLLQLTNTKLEVEPTTFKIRQSVDESVDNVGKKPRLKSYSQAIKIVKGHKDFAFFLATVFFMYLAFASVESFFSRFAIEFLGLYDQALLETGDSVLALQISESRASTLFLAYSAPMIIVAYFVGLLGQWKKVGKKNAIKIYLSWLIISTFIMAAFIAPIVYKHHNPLLVMTILALIAIPWMGFIVNSFALLWALASEGKKGIYTGIYYTFNQTAYTIAPILLGGVLSAFSVLGDFRYIVMFPFIVVCVIIALIFFFRIKGGDSSK